jgi:hypothetical protein
MSIRSPGPYPGQATDPQQLEILPELLLGDVEVGRRVGDQDPGRAMRVRHEIQQSAQPIVCCDERLPWPPSRPTPADACAWSACTPGSRRRSLSRATIALRHVVGLEHHHVGSVSDQPARERVRVGVASARRDLRRGRTRRTRPDAGCRTPGRAGAGRSALLVGGHRIGPLGHVTEEIQVGGRGERPGSPTGTTRPTTRDMRKLRVASRSRSYPTTYQRLSP